MTSNHLVHASVEWKATPTIHLLFNLIFSFFKHTKIWTYNDFFK